MTASIKTEPTFASLQDDLIVLKRDVATLIEHAKTGAASGAESVVTRLDDGAHRLYREAAAGGTKSVQAVSRKIVEQPIAALLIALGAGYLGGRFRSR